MRSIKVSHMLHTQLSHRSCRKVSYREGDLRGVDSLVVHLVSFGLTRNSLRWVVDGLVTSDHQSPILLAIGSNIIDLIQLYAIAGLTILRWEWHGKISNATSLAKRLILMDCQTIDPDTHAATPLSSARTISDLQRPYVAALSQPLVNIVDADD
jgi:hypothetical protein